MRFRLARDPEREPLRRDDGDGEGADDAGHDRGGDRDRTRGCERTPPHPERPYRGQIGGDQPHLARRDQGDRHHPRHAGHDPEDEYRDCERVDRLLHTTGAQSARVDVELRYDVPESLQELRDAGCAVIEPHEQRGAVRSVVVADLRAVGAHEGAGKEEDAADLALQRQVDRRAADADHVESDPWSLRCTGLPAAGDRLDLLRREAAHHEGASDREVIVTCEGFADCDLVGSVWVRRATGDDAEAEHVPEQLVVQWAHDREPDIEQLAVAVHEGEEPAPPGRLDAGEGADVGHVRGA